MPKNVYYVKPVTWNKEDDCMWNIWFGKWKLTSAPKDRQGDASFVRHLLFTKSDSTAVDFKTVGWFSGDSNYKMDALSSPRKRKRPSYLDDYESIVEVLPIAKKKVK